MKKINHYIKLLLARHECVVVPQLGGFVTQTQPAVLLPGKITPPQATICFNPLLKHDDGLLTLEVSRREKISYRKAKEYVESCVGDLITNITKNKSVEIEGIGILHKPNSYSDQLIFTPATNIGFLPQNIGLKTISVQDITGIAQAGRKQGGQNLSLRRTSKYAAAGALLFGLLLSSPKINNEGNINTYASILPVTSIELPEITVLPKNTFDGNKAADTTEGTERSKIYHIIIASLPDIDLANQLCKSLLAKGHKGLSILPSTSLYRVSLKSYPDKQEAIDNMRKLRKSTSIFEDAWVWSE